MDNRKVHISYKKFNPNFHHLKKALTDDGLRFIFLMGGSSSAKSFSVAQAMLLFCLTHGYNTRVYKKTGATISDSIYKTFQEAAKSIGVYRLFKFKENRIECINGSYVTFSGLDDPEKIKGLESYQFVVCEEISEFKEEDFKQIKKRLRGRPGQKVISMFNPISEDHWIKKNIFDKETLHEVSNHLYGELKDSSTGKILPEEYSSITLKMLNASRVMVNPRTKKEETHAPDMLILKSTYLNNFWVVGSPDGTYGFYDRQAVADFEKDKERDYNYYRIYALGDWGSIKTGGEYLHAFEAGKHTGECPYDGTLPIHISVDNNVLPYISVSFYQVDGRNMRQIHEICAEDPFNTVTKASEMSRMWLESINYQNVVFLHGDASTRYGNTIDDEKRSFLDKFMEGLEESYRVDDKIPDSNPPVAMSGEFINAILSGLYGLSISIDRSCKKSIRDYENVKKDVNGAILKQRVKNKLTNQSYEEFGHLTDCLRYVCVDVFKAEYTKFSLKRKRSTQKEKDMKYFDLSKVSGSKFAYVIPDSKGKFVVMSCHVNEFVDVADVTYMDSFDESVLRKGLGSFAPEDMVFECDKNFFHVVRTLREEGFVVRVLHVSTNMERRIEANKEFVRNRIRFRSDYDADEGYSSFLNDIMDYSGKEGVGAMNAVSALAQYSQKKFGLS